MVRIPDSECVSSNLFFVGEVDDRRIRLDHEYFPSVIAVLGESLKNVKKVDMGDKACVTMALMPDKKTVYCVRASIMPNQRISESQFRSSVHSAVNAINRLARWTALKILNSQGLDANGRYVGIGRLANAFKIVMRADKPGDPIRMREVKINGQMVAINRTMLPATGMQGTRLCELELIGSPAPPVHAVQSNRRERVESRMAPRHAPLLPTPSVSPDVSLSNETIVTTDQRKRQREQSPECQPAKRKKVEEKAVEPPEIEESTPVKRMGRREIIARMKKVILESSEILTMMANIDAELLAEIVQR